MRRIPTARGRGARTGGQSLVEFALVLPLVLLLLMVAVDFGRVYLGWINLNNAAREASNYAALNPRGWTGSGDVAITDRFASLVADETRSINCAPDPVGDPQFTSGAVLGGDAIVRIDCHFTPMTPLIAAVLGTDVKLSASANFPIRTGAIASLPMGGGGGGGGVIPVANFHADRLIGVTPLTVKFTDDSANAPTAWSWKFELGAAVVGTSTAQNPTYMFTAIGVYTVTLTAANINGSDDEKKAAYITVTVASTGPVADFVFAPLVGTAPLPVTFTDKSTGTPATWAWNFGDGTTASSQSPSHTYTNPGAYTIRLTVTNISGTNFTEKTLTVDRPICTVPNFAGVLKSAATALWASRGFAGTNITFDPPKNNGPVDYAIKKQSLVGGQVDPQPLGCGSAIVVGP